MVGVKYFFIYGIGNFDFIVWNLMKVFVFWIYIIYILFRRVFLKCKEGNKYFDFIYNVDWFYDFLDIWIKR